VDKETLVDGAKKMMRATTILFPSKNHGVGAILGCDSLMITSN
jgi:hypothetical protein